MDLVIKNADANCKILKNDWKLGWRLNLKDGTHDMMWGSTKPDEEHLQKVIADCRKKAKFDKVIDERAKNSA